MEKTADGPCTPGMPVFVAAPVVVVVVVFFFFVCYFVFFITKTCVF